MKNHKLNKILQEERIVNDDKKIDTYSILIRKLLQIGLSKDNNSNLQLSAIQTLLKEQKDYLNIKGKEDIDDNNDIYNGIKII